MTDDTQWGPWVAHVAGDPCPIPDVKAREWQYSFGIMPDRFVLGSADASEYEFEWIYKITHYRLRKPSPDWKGIAEELATGATDFWSLIQGEFGVVLGSDLQETHTVAKFFNALTRYREAIK